MGHFFRALNFLTYLHERNQPAILLLNEHQPSIAMLRARNIPFEIVPLDDLETGWEDAIIQRYQVTVWLNDRLDTDIRHAQRIKSGGVKLVTIDDRGSGAQVADLHFAPLILGEEEKLAGHKVYRGTGYLILNPEIDKFKKVRHRQEKILVTLGGSDTYGVTLKVVEQLKDQEKSATILTGPSFAHHAALKELITSSFHLLHGVPSLIETFSHFDLAITGGGVTPFEANASGLPCIVVANEWFEIPVGRHLEKLGGSVFAGFHDKLDPAVFARSLDIEAMSRAGMEHLTTRGAENIYREITLS
jgi:spore coat polysaccharide biosynthesis predicted glycosyltransferase SpsG